MPLSHRHRGDLQEAELQRSQGPSRGFFSRKSGWSPAPEAGMDVLQGFNSSSQLQVWLPQDWVEQIPNHLRKCARTALCEHRDPSGRWELGMKDLHGSISNHRDIPGHWAQRSPSVHQAAEKVQNIESHPRHHSKKPEWICGWNCVRFPCWKGDGRFSF